MSSGFTYDADGNMLTGNGRTITWTSFGMVKSVTLNGKTVTYSYDPEHQRITQTTPEDATINFPGYDLFVPSGLTTNQTRTYIRDGNGQRAGEIYRTGISPTAGTAAARFYVNDWQNSVSAMTDANGNLTELDSYDAWGKRRYVNGIDDTADALNSVTVRGYTNQEHVYDAQLIDLNARMYDPFIGKMLSVDPVVANWLDSQAWNAYAYARNNPMAYTDPTGMDACSNDPDCSVVYQAPYNNNSAGTSSNSSWVLNVSANGQSSQQVNVPFDVDTSGWDDGQVLFDGQLPAGSIHLSPNGDLWDNYGGGGDDFGGVNVSEHWQANLFGGSSPFFLPSGGMQQALAQFDMQVMVGMVTQGAGGGGSPEDSPQRKQGQGQTSSIIIRPKKA